MDEIYDSSIRITPQKVQEAYESWHAGIAGRNPKDCSQPNSVGHPYFPEWLELHDALGWCLFYIDMLEDQLGIKINRRGILMDKWSNNEI